MKTYVVCQKNAKGRKSMEVGSFQSDRADKNTLQEEMYRYLHNSGITPAGYAKFFIKN